MPTAMASLYSDITTKGYFSNESLNDSVYNKTNMSSSLLKRDSGMFDFIVFTVVAGIICVVGFVANIICYNILKRGKKQCAATFLLQTLAVADNLVLTLFLVFSIIFGLLPMLGMREERLSILGSQYFAMYIGPFLNTARTSTVWITVLIAINRYIAVCCPLDACRLASLTKTKIQVAVVFTLAFIFNMPLFFQYTIVYPKGNGSSMPSLTQTSIGPSTLFGIVHRSFILLALLVCPLVFLIIFNSRIIWELRKADKWKGAVQQNGSKSEKGITRVMVVIIIVFIMCSMPLHIYMVARYFTQNNYGWYAFHCVCQVFVAANSSTNFVVYYVLRKSFRRAFYKALCCFCCCQPQALV